MIQRVLRFILSLFSAYSFYTNPLQFVVTTIGVSLIPILLYAIGGLAAFVILLLIIGFFMYRAISANNKKEQTS